jgi:hypothetical protein
MGALRLITNVATREADSHQTHAATYEDQRPKTNFS